MFNVFEKLGVLAATTTVAFTMVAAAPVAAEGEADLPEVGQCYDLTKEQEESTPWIGGNLVECSETHNVEITTVQQLPRKATTQQIAVRMGAWVCLDTARKHGPITRLNGWGYGYYVNSTINVEGEQGFTVTCGTYMVSQTGKHLPTTKLWANSSEVGPACVRWNGKSGKGFHMSYSPCRRGTYKVGEAVLLDKTFNAKYPGAKALERRAIAACGDGLRTWPSKERWKSVRYGRCYSKVR